MIIKVLNFLFSEPGIHHIPLDIHGFPDVPTFDLDEKTNFFESGNRRKTNKKPLYKPPPVLTKYSPPDSMSRNSQEYRHQYPEESDTNFKISKVKQHIQQYRK